MLVVYTVDNAFCKVNRLATGRQYKMVAYVYMMTCNVFYV